MDDIEWRKVKGATFIAPLLLLLLLLLLSKELLNVYLLLQAIYAMYYELQCVQCVQLTISVLLSLLSRCFNIGEWYDNGLWYTYIYIYNAQYIEQSNTIESDLLLMLMLIYVCMKHHYIYNDHSPFTIFNINFTLPLKYIYKTLKNTHTFIHILVIQQVACIKCCFDTLH